MFILFSLLITAAQISGDGDPTILNAAGDELPYEEFIEALSAYDVIFAGEQHDAGEAHEAELAILTSLAEQDQNLVLALEMFEQDVQEALDAYLAGEISKDSFLAGSRPWPNYATDYRPLIEFAKSKAIPVVAANVPRRAAAAVARTGEVTPQVLGVDSIYMPDTLHLDSRKYYQRFEATMQAMTHGSPMGTMNIESLYKAQVLKDAAMAQSLHPWLQHPILFFCGRFHCDYHLGTPYQLTKNHPDLKIAVVTLASSSETFEDPEDIADYIWLY